MKTSPEPISLDHKVLLHDRLKAAGTSLSEFSFANLYLFRGAHDYRVLRREDDVYITGKTYDGFRHIMPTVDVRLSGKERLLEAARDYDFIFPVPEEWLGAFAPEDFVHDFGEGDSDYIYTTERLATYRGQALHGQKNLLHQFMARYTPRPAPLTPDLMTDALGVLDAWQEAVGERKEKTDYFPCREAFRLYEELGLCGVIYYVDGEPAGFIVGEEINPRMFDLHFAKGKRKFKGMYQYMYQHFANILPEGYERLNFEQDMGLLALRIAKSSYHPETMVKKFRVKMKVRSVREGTESPRS